MVLSIAPRKGAYENPGKALKGKMPNPKFLKKEASKSSEAKKKKK